jgi:hypothetical protein
MNHIVAGLSDEERDLLIDVQGWCPKCGGTGMVMTFQPDDCPNLDAHRLLSRLYSKPVQP